MGISFRFARRLALFLMLVVSPRLFGYSMLSHEEIIDLAWTDQIEPLLLQRYPDASDDELREAHSYAYGGCVIQDLGYYPFGSKDFSNLVHYVRSGDFVATLLQDAQDINEYAFALGALAHYAADTEGHPAINRAVAIAYPKLRAKYGDRVTYEDDHRAHIRTEFGFDVVQVAKNRYTSDSYHNFIGFRVSKPLLERGFRETYGIELSDVFGNVDLAIGSYRRSISTIIPEMTRVALATKRADIVRETPNFDQQKFLYRLSRSNYEKEWGKDYQKPGAGARTLALFIRIMPKIGPLRTLDFTIPSRDSEDLYIKSVNKTVDYYKAQLKILQLKTNLNLPNRDFDTGKPTVLGEYALADQTTAMLVGKLAGRHLDLMNSDLQASLLAFYGNTNSPTLSELPPPQRQQLTSELDEIKSWGPAWPVAASKKSTE